MVVWWWWFCGEDTASEPQRLPHVLPALQVNRLRPPPLAQETQSQAAIILHSLKEREITALTKIPLSGYEVPHRQILPYRVESFQTIKRVYKRGGVAEVGEEG